MPAPESTWSDAKGTGGSLRYLQGKRLTSKETGIVFLFLGNLYTFLYNKSKLLLVAVTSLFAVGIYLFIRFFIGNVYFAKSLLIAPIANIPLQERLLSVPSVIFYYFKTFFYPVSLGINQHWIIRTPTFNNFDHPNCQE